MKEEALMRIGGPPVYRSAKCVYTRQKQPVESSRNKPNGFVFQLCILVIRAAMLSVGVKIFIDKMYV
jgi:hypothetical protein